MNTDNQIYICSHSRDLKGDKVCGGAFRAENIADAYEKAASSMTVGFSPSGRAEWIDRQGRRVSIYLSVHPEFTAKGRVAIADENRRREAERKAKQKRIEEQEETLSNLIEKMGGTEKAIEFLQNQKKQT